MGIDLEKGFCDSIKKCFGIDSNSDVREYSPLTLAYIGDAVYEIIIRSMLVLEEEKTVQKYHKKCSGYVNCTSQRELLVKIEPLLTDEERAVYKRGRNAKSYTMPKNAVPADYRVATGFECLCGFLYLTDNMERLLWLIGEGFKEENQ